LKLFLHAHLRIKALWQLERSSLLNFGIWGMKFATVADKRKGEKFISARGKSNGCRRCFFLLLTWGNSHTGVADSLLLAPWQGTHSRSEV